jgi:hypothetical protein
MLRGILYRKLVDFFRKKEKVITYTTEPSVYERILPGMEQRNIARTEAEKQKLEEKLKELEKKIKREEEKKEKKFLKEAKRIEDKWKKVLKEGTVKFLIDYKKPPLAKNFIDGMPYRNENGEFLSYFRGYGFNEDKEVFILLSKKPNDKKLFVHPIYGLTYDEINNLFITPEALIPSLSPGVVVLRTDRFGNYIPPETPSEVLANKVEKREKIKKKKYQKDDPPEESAEEAKTEKMPTIEFWLRNLPEIYRELFVNLYLAWKRTQYELFMTKKSERALLEEKLTLNAEIESLKNQLDIAHANFTRLLKQHDALVDENKNLRMQLSQANADMFVHQQTLLTLANGLIEVHERFRQMLAVPKEEVERMKIRDEVRFATSQLSQLISLARSIQEGKPQIVEKVEKEKVKEAKEVKE